MSISSTDTEPAESRSATSTARATARSLRIRLALGFGLLAIALSAALALAIGELATNLARKEIGRYLIRLSIEMRDKLDAGMAERFSEIGMLANLDATFDGARSAGMRRTLLDEFKRAAPDYAWIGYIDQGGRVQLALGGLFEGQDVSSRPWFKGALAGPYIGDVHESVLLAALTPPGKKPPQVIDVAYPLKNARGTSGVIGAQISWEWVARLRDSIESYAQPEMPFDLLVVASDGLVLLGPSGIIGTRLARNELSPSQLHTYDARLEQWPDGQTYLLGSSATRAFGNTRGLGWSVIARQRADHAFAPIRLLQKRIAIAGGLIALLTIALGWWIAVRVSAPLAAISATADSISRGSRRVRIPSGGGYAEVEQLSASLRTMLGNLNRHEEDLQLAQNRLESRVRERTAELTKARAEMELESVEHAMARDEASAAKDRLAMAMEASRLILWDYDVRSGRIALSEAWSALLGGPPMETTETMESLTGLVPEEDRAAVREAVGTALKGPVSAYRVEHRVRTASGVPVWIVSEGRVVERDASGRAVRMIGTNRDITERVRDHEALRESEERFRRLTGLYSDWYWELDADFRFTRIEGAGLAKIGVEPAGLVGRTYRDFPRYELLSMSAEEFARVHAEHKRYVDLRGRFVMDDGTYRYVSVTGEPVIGDDGVFRGYRGVTRDITDQAVAEESLRESEARFKGAFNYSATGMALIALDGRWLKVNRALCEITGYSEDELLARSFQTLTHPDDLQIGPASLGDLLSGKVESIQIEKRYMHKRGHSVWVQVNVSLVRDQAGGPQHFISQTLDISDRRALQKRAEHLALHDPLTGLPNSRLLLDRLEQVLAAARRAKRPMGVMYMDLDGFKPVNDTHGHAAGDLVLKEFAARLARVLRDSDTVARAGGDEFVAVLGEGAGEAEARTAAERVLAAVAVPFDFGTAQASLSASIGIALYPAHGEDAQSLLQRADSAMYKAKHAGKNSYRLFAGDPP